MTGLSALIVDDDTDFRESLALLVRRDGFDVRTAASLEAARAELQRGMPDVVLMDLQLPDGNGLQFLREENVLRATEVVVITGDATVESAVEALQQGAADYVSKPIDRLRLAACLRNVGRTRALKRKVVSLNSELRDIGRFGGKLIGTSAPMRTVFDLIERVAPTDASVFISGESGVGKELVVQTIHQLSPRAEGPLLPINCGAVPGNLMESELFGHERGSFTGAERRREGCFERCRGGTLFLDEITEMPIELQVKLLRVLESHVVSRVGGDELIEVDVRIVVASNREPHQAVESGALREDLFYRLNVFPIVVPPLRERSDDVVVLAEHFLAELNAAHATAKRFTPEALQDLSARTWRGNVRELKNAVSRAFIMADVEIDVEALSGTRDRRVDGQASGALEVRVGSSIRDVERTLIEATLEQVGGDKVRAAKVLGISVKTLYTRLSLYGASRSSS